METAPIRLRIPELRARLDRITQSELAKRAGLSPVTISNLESGRLKRIKLLTIAKLCKALDCTPADLFELPKQSEHEVAQRQKAALKGILGSLKFNKPAVAEHLDKELSQVTNNKLKSSKRSPARKQSA